MNELDNSDNLKDGRPSNTLFTYYVTSPEDFTGFEPSNPRCMKLKYDEIVSLTLKITDQNNNIINIGPGTIVVLHIRQLKCTSLLITKKVSQELTYIIQFRILSQTRKSQLSEC